MDSDLRFIMQKKVDWSLLNYGLPIPVSAWNLFQARDSSILTHGVKRPIKIIIGDKLFDAVLVNQNFNKNKFPDHKDLIQIRYNQQSAIAKELRKLFWKSYNYISSIRKLRENQRRPVALPNNINEFIRLCFTQDPNTFYLDCNTDEEYNSLLESLHEMDEETYESEAFSMLVDDKAHVSFSDALHKVRHLDRSIGDSLKQIYDYRCQMTGERIGDTQNALCVEAHHIIPFTKSLNNDYSNIIILSPSYHRIVHKAKPEFNFGTLSFLYPNGLVERVKLNKHLNTL